MTPELMVGVPGEDSEQSVCMRSLSSVFAVRLNKHGRCIAYP